MTNQEANDARAISSAPVLSIEEVRKLEIVQIKSVREGEEPSYSYNFCPSIRNVPKDFFVMSDISWVPCDEEKVSRTISSWVQHLRERGSSGGLIGTRRNRMLPLELSRRAHSPVVQRLDFNGNRHWQRRQSAPTPLRRGAS